MYASDYRRDARCALMGKWAIAVLAGFIAMLVGAVSYDGPRITLNINSQGTSFALSLKNQVLYSFGSGTAYQVAGFLQSFCGIMLVLALLVVSVLLVSVIAVGYAKFNLDLVDRQQEAKIGSLFAYFPNWTTAVCARVLQILYIVLWYLLLIVPGIMATYSYAMTEFILAEHPELSASEAIAKSKQIMQGNRWNLFCLDFSFIGWRLLSVLTLGIGYLWLQPYMNAARASFYREVSRGAFAQNPQPFDVEG